MERRRPRKQAARPRDCGGVADYGDGLHYGTGRDLPERDRVEELRTRHPVIAADPGPSSGQRIPNGGWFLRYPPA
jgi:hypothetical protein